MLFKIYYLIIHYLNAFVFQKLLHEVGAVEVVLAGEKADFVDHTVSWYFGQVSGSVHGPADHSGTSGGAEIFGNSAIRGNSALGDLTGDFVDLFEEILIIGIHN